MMNKQELLVELLREHLDNVKTGIIIKGIDGISPEEIAQNLVDDNSKLYIAVVGYDNITPTQNESFELTDKIEKAVLWRSNPEFAGHILVFIRNDADKLHSLAEFDTISTRDISHFLLEKQLKNDNNTPTHNFWEALLDTSDYYMFDTLYEFVSAVQKSKKPADAIPQNMWRLNLLLDAEILGTKSNPKERLAKNRNLILAIEQLSEDSRKKLNRSLARTKGEDKKRLQSAYQQLQNLYKNTEKKKILKELDISTIEELFSASQKKEKRKNPTEQLDDPIIDNNPNDTHPIKPKELNDFISKAVVFDDEEDTEKIKELYNAFNKLYNAENEEIEDELPTIDGRTITFENNQTDLRKLVGKFCNMSAWGGIMETEESVLRDAISADIINYSYFDPTNKDSIISFVGGVDGNQPLFDFISQFDLQFEKKGIETAERFKSAIEDLMTQRKKLLESLDMIMYQPVLLFGASDEQRNVLIDYIQAWETLYHSFCVNEPVMSQISSIGTSFIARSLLLLDVLYVKTPKEWKAILLPLHPVFLWRYYEVFRMLPSRKSTMNQDDKDALKTVLSQLPQILSFIIANSMVTGTSEDRILPCSGSIEMLPTFENKTNRYLGNDGTNSVEEILTRWIGFAPYTRKEVRICSVDAPDLIGIIRQLKRFMDKNDCRRVVYDVYLTRNQNGNTELAKLEYAGADYEIGEYIKQDRISISIKNVHSPNEVKEALKVRPVHVAFYFDQSSYAIEFGPNSRNLYINPLVITYNYEFDEIQHRGILYPSSEMNSGLIGDYHKMLRAADVISNNMNPRTIYNANVDMTSVVSTVEGGQTQWLVVADRDTNNYQPNKSIPIGEMQYDKRMVNAWASDNSRIINQYMKILREYNLYPKTEVLIEILKEFGHIASNGLISIPKAGANSQAISNKRKGLIGTLFAASWYMKQHKDALVASLDDDKARLWLQNRKYGNERADLIGLYYDEQNEVLHIQPIEVKTRDESPDAVIAKDETKSNTYTVSGHAAEQIASVIVILRDICNNDDELTDMFTYARREVLKFQIYSECFRNIHDSEWQKKWYDILKRAFENGSHRTLTIDVSGILMHINLSESDGGKHLECYPPEFDDCKIEYWKLTTKEIQRDVLGDETISKELWTPDFDNTEDSSFENEEIVIDKDFSNESNTSSDGIESIGSQSRVSLGTSSTIEIEEIPSFSVNEKGVEKVTTINNDNGVDKLEIQQLVKDFMRACGDYNITLKECNPENTVVGPSVIRLKFRLGRGQTRQRLSAHLEDIGREMKRTGVIVQSIINSDELLLDIPRLKREKVLFRDVLNKMPPITSPEQLYFPLGRTPNGVDLIEDLGQMPHMLVGGSTGSGKTVFLFTLLSSLLMTHPHKEDMQLILSSSKLEDFVYFEGLPHLYSGKVISDATEATKVIKEVIFDESERRGKLLADARVANIIEYNKTATEKLPPIVVVIDEFADLSDQLETTKEKNAFYKPVQRIAQAGRSRGIHLVICTQRPEAKLVPATTKAQLNGRIALRVNDGISSRMIIEESDAQYLQKHGDMIYRNGDTIERAQGYLIEINELMSIINDIINGKYN